MLVARRRKQDTGLDNLVPRSVKPESRVPVRCGLDVLKGSLVVFPIIVPDEGYRSDDWWRGVNMASSNAEWICLRSAVLAGLVVPIQSLQLVDFG